VFHARTGSLLTKIPLKQSAVKVWPASFVAIILTSCSKSLSVCLSWNTKRNQQINNHTT
jgi:hypothetical protein